jgi:two-component system cell cycle sensor histidine kinase/response regulator CckA
MRTVALIVAGLLAIGAGWLWLRPRTLENRVYRIGWMISPPFEVAGPDGGAAGIAVDLVNLAARRRGIQITWVRWPQSSESALRTGSVDLWPLITVTPERLKVLHISEPYLRHEHCLLVRDDAPTSKPAELATAKIGMANPSIDRHNLAKVLPSAIPAPQATIAAVLKDVCTGATQGAFMDRFTAMTALLGQYGCDGHSLRWLAVPQVQSQLGVGSTFEAADVADAIRAEIGALAREGKLPEVFGQWGFLSTQDVAAVESLISARRREAYLMGVVVVFAVLLIVAGSQTVRVTRERNRTRRTEAALQESQQRLLQAQKMESVGRLAGGIAHDFNNLLTVINGYSDLVLGQMPESDPRRAQIAEIHTAGQRAAELTSQLLTFGRKQVVRPRPLNLNSVIAESEKMLRRLIGEDIEMVKKLDAATGVVLVDPGHIHQVLMNLAVNARDAMPRGGTLLIETSDEHCEAPPVGSAEAKAGSFVRLTVRDTGHGMDEATLKNIFEPFFTTKGTKGTGLGLATVYSIVQQSHGWIDVSSTLGKGTTIHIFLPHAEAAIEPVNDVQPVNSLRKSTTVLVVEDQEDVRNFVTRVLAEKGYHVLAADDGATAITLAREHHGKIDVLLTDVVLPGMNGPEIANHFKSAHHSIKVIYTSGYTRDLITDRGILPKDIAYLPKPYTAEQIIAKVREATQ